MTKSEEYYEKRGNKSIGIKKCENCGLEFKIYTKRDIEKKKFCSKKCSAQKNWLKLGIGYGRPKKNRVLFKCNYCNKETVQPEYIYIKHNKHFCCDNCRREYKTTNINFKIKFNCEFCGKEKEERKDFYKKSNHHFCSTTCFQNYRRQNNSPIIKPCPNCKKEFIIDKQRSKNNRKKFCSKKCGYEYKRKTNTNGKNFLCPNCNKEFHRTLREMHTKRKLTFCSRKCNSVFYGKLKLVNYKRKTPLRKLIKNSTKYKEWQTFIYKSNEFKCSKCGENKHLHAHHIKIFSEIFREFLNLYHNLNPKDNLDELFILALEYKPFWDINNGKTLCVTCHQKEHPELHLTLTENLRKKNSNS